jgi:hypothetical protein
MVAMWEKHEGPQASIWAARYDVGNGWGRAMRLGAGKVGRALAPKVAMDGQGNAVAAWFQVQGNMTEIWAARYTGTSGWGPPERLDKHGNAINPQVTMDSRGQATVVWSEYIDNNFSLWSSRFE